MAIATGIALFKYLKMAPALFLVVVCDSDLTPFLALCGYDGNEDGSVHYEEAQREAKGRRAFAASRLSVRLDFFTNHHAFFAQ